MSDLIDREDVIKTVSNLMKNEDDWYREAFKSAIRAIPSADVVSLEEFEQMRFLADKSMEMVGEPTWTDVLAKLHERFDALEKEIRKASAEMSAVIREYVDGQKDEPQTGYVLSKDSDAYKFNKRMEVEEMWLNEQREHDILYEPTYNKDDGSM